MRESCEEFLSVQEQVKLLKGKRVGPRNPAVRVYSSKVTTMVGGGIAYFWRPFCVLPVELDYYS